MAPKLGHTKFFTLHFYHIFRIDMEIKSWDLV
jgi:hypothetical protein